MTVDQWLSQAASILEKSGISTARLDSLVLLKDALNTNKAHLLAHPETRLSPAEQKLLDAQIVQRSQHIPLAYIRGKTEFYGRQFTINEHVLEPRPESETMIELLKELFKKHRISEPKIADIGCGSGALGITAGLELGLQSIHLLDISYHALEVAAQNASLLKQSVILVQNDLLKNNNEYFDVLLCNLPYVPDTFQINTAALHEPKLAIFGGPDGLNLYRQLFEQLDSKSKKPRLILTESLPPQHETLSEIAAAHGFKLHTEDDFIQVFTPKK